jgi:hypothetical protein
MSHGKSHHVTGQHPDSSAAERRERRPVASCRSRAYWGHLTAGMAACRNLERLYALLDRISRLVAAARRSNDRIVVGGPRCRWRRVSLANKPSSGLSQDAELGGGVEV